MPDLSFLFVQALNGLASASSLFIIAAGLTIVFGVTRIVNFAHGSFYMLGAYFGVTLIPRLLDVSNSLPMFLAGVLAGGARRRADRRGRWSSCCCGASIGCPSCSSCSPPSASCWPCRTSCSSSGGRSTSWARARRACAAPSTSSAIAFPAYELFLIAMGPLVLGLLWLLMHKTRFGVLVRAATQDREMVAALGRQPGAAVHRHAVPRRALAGPRRRAADAQARRQPAHGHLGHRRGLRRDGGGRHGLGARRLPGGAADRRSCRRSASWSSPRSPWCWCSC